MYSLLTTILTEVGFITSTPSTTPVPRRIPSFPYIPVGSSPPSPSIKSNLPTGINLLIVIQINDYNLISEILCTEQKSTSLASANTSLQFQKGVNSSVLYTSQNWDLEDELYDEESIMKMCKTMEKEELQSSKGTSNTFGS